MSSAAQLSGKRSAIVAFAALAAAGAAVGCSGDQATAKPGSGVATAPALAVPDTISTPAGQQSGEPNLVASAAGLYLSWLEPTDGDRHALRFARWEGDGWGEPGQVMDRTDLFVNWADFPAFTALEDGTLAAHWLEKSGPGPYSYDVRMALSHDGGRSWGEDIIPHRDGVQAEHGFVSLLAMDGELGVSWLDGRETVNGAPMTVRYTTLSADGELGAPALLDASVCDCCQTGIARTSAGPIVAYRDRTEDEVRDIYVVRQVDGEWTDPQVVHEDGWVIPGCPVNGPSIDASEQEVAVAWFTGAPLDADAAREEIRQAGSEGRVQAAFSSDGGATFSDPIRVDDGAAMGRVELVLLDDGTAMVVWLERVDGAAEIRARRVNREGVGTATSITSTAAERASGFPHIARWEDRLFFAWTEGGDQRRVRTAAAPLPPMVAAGDAE